MATLKTQDYTFDSCINKMKTVRVASRKVSEDRRGYASPAD